MTTTKEFPMQSTTTYLSRPEGRIAYDVAGDGPLVVLVPLAASIMPAVAVGSEG
jgi:hypothetical protein